MELTSSKMKSIRDSLAPSVFFVHLTKNENRKEHKQSNSGGQLLC
jgi:hypothetical protein